MAGNSITMLDYNKITDTLMYLAKGVTLNFTVSLCKVNPDTNKIVSAHNEYKYYSAKLGQNSLSIKRNIDCYFVVNVINDFNNCVPIKPKDVFLFNYVVDNNVLPWFMGDTRIFAFDNNSRLILKGKYNKVDFPINDYKYLSMIPIIITYDDGTTKEGVRIYINSEDFSIDVDINKFLEFYYYIHNTDMYVAATNLLLYVKAKPYGIHVYDMDSNNDNSYAQSEYYYTEELRNTKSKEKKKNFFDQ